MIMNYYYPTTIFRSIFAQNVNVQISGRKNIYIYIHNFSLSTIQGQNDKMKIMLEIHIFGSKYF